MYDSDFLHEKFPRPTNDEELLEREGDVYDFFRERFPRKLDTIDKHMDALAKHLREIQKVFPDAKYIVDQHGYVSLILGDLRTEDDPVPNTCLRVYDNLRLRIALYVV